MVQEGKFIINNDTGETVDIKNSDFEFVQKDKRIHDVKFSGKATTFFKDAMRRFIKSKPAFAGGIIVGLLIVLAVLVPAVMPSNGAYNVDRNAAGGDVSERFVQPKLFPAGTGFWDGTIKKSGILFNTETGLPNGYREGVFFNLETYESEVNQSGPLGKGGYVNVFAYDSNTVGNLYTDKFLNFDFANEYSLEMSISGESFDSYVPSKYRVLLLDANENRYYLTSNGTDEFVPIGNGKVNININDVLSEETTATSLSARVRIEVENVSNGQGSILISSLNITTTTENEEDKALFESYSFNDANQMLLKTKETGGFWGTTSGKAAYKINYTYCNFVYDQYKDLYGEKSATYTNNGLLQLQTQGSFKLNLSGMTVPATSDPEVLAERFQILDNCPIIKVVEQVGDATYNIMTRSYEGYELKVIVSGYRQLGYDSMPLFLFGTNTNRKDYFKLIFTSLRFSFLLAIGVSAVNIIFGLIWGSISGYFGGWTDILMERFCEILSSLPTTVIITLCILYGSEFEWGDMSDVLALMVALFLTGWMGVSARTRTQFYRFKGREYVLASRTLGARDSRLIFRHILPNSMGTIITGSILMIPSVVYTEASIAYLGLGLQGQNMFGVILSEANTYYQGENTYLLIIPTCIMALLLVSFNLFGNGLRDAFNPQLKGSN